MDFLLDLGDSLILTFQNLDAFFFDTSTMISFNHPITGLPMSIPNVFGDLGFTLVGAGLIGLLSFKFIKFILDIVL